MKIIVAGNRTYKNHEHICAVLDAVVQKRDVVLQGGASGVDRVAQTWARTHGVACRQFEAAWEQLGSAAGRVRNAQMAQEADALIAFWDGESPGTGSMIRCMQVLKKPIFYVRYDAVHLEEAGIPF